jgi:hypothetical protein
VCVLQLASNRLISNFCHVKADNETRRKKTVSRDPNDKHAVQCRDVYVWSHPDMSPGKEAATLEGEKRTATRSDEWWGPDETVVAMTFMFWTSKNSGYHVRPYWLKKGRAPSEDQLIDDLLLSMSFCVGGAKHLFFARHSALREAGARLTGATVTGVIKATAEYMGCSPRNFATTSNRSSGASAVKESGATPLEVVSWSGHHSLSVPQQHYIFEAPAKEKGTQHRGGLLGVTLDGDLGFSTADATTLLYTMWLAERTAEPVNT